MQPRLDIFRVLLLALLRLLQDRLVLFLAHQLGEVSDLLLGVINSLDEGLIQGLGYTPSEISDDIRQIRGTYVSCACASTSRASLG